MANFKEFRTLLQKHFDEMVKDGAPLFITNADEDKLYNLYLDSVPAGTNPTFRKRREYDCSCCRRFVKNIGKLVSFMDGQMVTVWDFDTKSDVYQPVVDALAAYVKTCAVVNPYYISRNMISDGKFGTEMNYEYDADHKAVRTWDHFAVEIPQRFIVNSYDVSTKMAEWRDSANVFKRSLECHTIEYVRRSLYMVRAVVFRCYGDNHSAVRIFTFPVRITHTVDAGAFRFRGCVDNIPAGTHAE